MGAFRQWNDHYSFMYELHKALAICSETKAGITRDTEEAKAEPVDAQQRNVSRVCSAIARWSPCCGARGEDGQNGRSTADRGRHAETSRQDAPRGARHAAGDATRGRSSRRTSFDSPRSLRDGSFKTLRTSPRRAESAAPRGVRSDYGLHRHYLSSLYQTIGGDLVAAPSALSSGSA